MSASRWKEESRLAQFEPLALGVPLSNFPKSEEGFLLVTEQISALVKVIQVRLNESRFYRYHPVLGEQGVQPASKNSLPYLGENPEQFDFNRFATTTARANRCSTRSRVNSWVKSLVTVSSGAPDG